MPARKLALLASVVFLSSLAAASAQASSPQAWEDFRRDVEASCLQAAASQIEAPQIVVDPFGSQSYGLALLRGPSVEDGSPQSLICVYDKASRTVEVGGVMALERTLPAATEATDPTQQPPGDVATQRLLSPDPLAPASEMTARTAESSRPGAPATERNALCDGPCPPTFDRLTPDDREALFGLPAQIERTVAAGEGASLGPAPASARAAASAAAQAAGGGASPALPLEPSLVGTAPCTLYYFGFEGEAARTVGTHRCAVSAGSAGGLVVEKTSGERLRADLEPLRGDVSMFAGRSFEAGAERQTYDPAVPRDDPASELGNVVGFAVRTADGVYLVSSQRRRFDPSDNFFWVLALDRP